MTREDVIKRLCSGDKDFQHIEEVIKALNVCMRENAGEDDPCNGCYLKQLSRGSLSLMSTGHPCYEHLAFDAIDLIRDARETHAENAALRKKLEQEYIDGAKYAIYEIMKEADIPGSQAIRDSGGTIDTMCAAVADKIREVLEGSALKAENAKLRSNLKTMREEYLETCSGDCAGDQESGILPCKHWAVPDVDENNMRTKGYCSIRAELKEE